MGLSSPTPELRTERGVDPAYMTLESRT